MSVWPEQIPHDLQVGFENNRADAWLNTMQKWAEYHGLKLKTRWFRKLEISMAELHDRRLDASPKDHWYLIRIWLIRHDVAVPNSIS